MKKLFALIFGLVISIILLLVSEWIIRISIPEIKPYGTQQGLIADSVFYASPGLKAGAKGKSNGANVIVDKYNCRISSVKTDIRKRGWLWLGDSVTMGIGISADSTFAGRMQNRIDSLHIYNPSLIGYSISDYFNVFQHFIINNPDSLNFTRVTLFWCLNDVYNEVKNIEQPGGNWRSLFKNMLVWLRVHSRLYLFFKSFLFDRPKSYFLFDKKYYSAEDKDFIKAIQIIRQINKLSELNDITFQIVFLPYEYQLRTGDQTPQALLKSQLIKKEIPYIDLFDNLVNSTDYKSYYLYGDGIHFSDNGHKVITEFLLNSLKK